MNDLIRPAFYDAYHEIVPLTRKGGVRLSSPMWSGRFANPATFFAKTARCQKPARAIISRF